MPKRAFLFFLLALLAGMFFWQAATGVNATKYDREEYRRVQHPDFIPTRNTLAIAGGGYDLAIGDAYWLKTVQYIWTHAVGAEYKAYLAALLGLITDIDPKMTEAYTLGLILLPSINPQDSAESERHLSDAIALGKKSIAKLCDAQKIARIGETSDMAALEGEELQNPCTSLWPALYLGYDYYFYADDPASAVDAYKIASAHTDAPMGVRTLTATLLADSGDSLAAAKMLLQLAEAASVAAPVCASTANTLGEAFDKDIADGFLEYTFREPAHRAIEFVDTYETSHSVEAGFCQEYLSRFERMVQLAHARQADETYAREHDWKHVETASELFESGYLPYEPQDFQRFSDGSKIVYMRDAKSGRWVVRTQSKSGIIREPKSQTRY